MYFCLLFIINEGMVQEINYFISITHIIGSIILRVGMKMYFVATWKFIYSLSWRVIL